MSLQPHLIFLERALSMYEIFNLNFSQIEIGSEGEGHGMRNPL